MKPGYVSLNMNVRKKTKELAKKAAERDDLNLSQWVAIAIQEKLGAKIHK